MSDAMLSFKLGPVQPFIESARTLRDLWSGSYLLSWLTAYGIKAIFNKPGVTFITPDVDPNTNPLFNAVINRHQKDPNSTLACIPHTFAAVVPANDAAKLKSAVLDAVKKEWFNIAAEVKKAIEPTLNKEDTNWAENWDAQINDYFEFKCVFLTMDQAQKLDLDAIGVHLDDSQDPANALWGQQWNMLGGLLDATRSVRHVPQYTPISRGGKFSVKCSLLGSYEQIGPPDMADARQFWEKITTPNWKGYHGTRLQSSDRLCAISLVKRFAWPAYWAGKLGLPIDELRFTDTTTMAASSWLRNDQSEVLNPETVRKKRKKWSGQWLHWTKRDQEEDDDCHDDEWNIIIRKKHKQGLPPTYYALMLLDGDNMGNVFQGTVGQKFGNGLVRFQEVTRRLTSFALTNVKPIVERHHGELIYAGGDDVMAFLPTETAIVCAYELRKAFGEVLTDATLSGGIAIVHYKEDLRFALSQVRQAEKAAKQTSKKYGDGKTKDALAVSVCKRSGEHATAVMGWGGG